MRWLADECAAAPLVDRLRRAGHDVTYIAELSPGSPDASVVDLAMQQGRLLLTEDKDFGDLVFRLGRPVPGIVLLRVAPGRVQLQGDRLMAAMERFGEGLLGSYLVIEDARFRSRPLWNDRR